MGFLGGERATGGGGGGCGEVGRVFVVGAGVWTKVSAEASSCASQYDTESNDTESSSGLAAPRAAVLNANAAVAPKKVKCCYCCCCCCC